MKTNKHVMGSMLREERNYAKTYFISNNIQISILARRDEIPSHCGPAIDSRVKFVMRTAVAIARTAKLFSRYYCK